MDLFVLAYILCLDLQILTHVAVSCALHVGLSNEFVVPRDDLLLASFNSSMVKYISATVL